ncbi:MULTISPECIES: aldehyde dehydrogenase family protein [unclassified Mycolicibacterium]|uniref:aldehyde dehydrogenase family protein n=1 Tax=unclassified Mycolicibacterium TaxID=2636767 RepID=UPI002ED81364
MTDTAPNSYQDLFDRQKRHFATGATRSHSWRVEQLDSMARLIVENEEAPQQAVAADFKTASQEKIFETGACLAEVEFQNSQLRDWMAPTEVPVPRALAATGQRGVIYRDPYGVALVIGPSNGPLTLLLRPAIAALAAGNACVLKLSAALSATSALFFDLVPRYFQPEAVAAITGNRAEVADEFVAKAKAALVELYGEDPKSNPDFSRMISVGEVKRLASLIDPAKVVAGGQSDADERYLDPTIVYPVHWGDPVMEDEVFGPILPIMTYRDLDEAFARIAAAPNPLAAYIFSQDQATIDRFIGELSFGGGAVNQVNIHLFVESMPFGGVGASGIGHYHGKYGFDTLTHAKSMLISPADVAIDHLFPPYSPEKNAELKMWFEY